MTARRGKPTLAVVGATGAVGTVMLDLLSTRLDVWGEIRLVASARSAGKHLRVRGEDVEVVALAPEVFDGVDVAMFDVPDEVSAEWAPIAAARGAVAVDNSGAFRMDPDVPLVVPEVNPAQVRNRPKGIISNPNCTTLSMIVALGALHRRYGLRELVVASYQAASGAGQSGIDTLRAQLAKVADDPDIGTRPGDVRQVVGDFGPFPAPLAMNVVPWAGSLRDGGWSSEELKVRNESRKILGHARPQGLGDLRTRTRHHDPLARGARRLRAGAVAGARRRRSCATRQACCWSTTPSSASSRRRPTPSAPTRPGSAGYAPRSTTPYALELFVCGDNLRKGAALNTAQIAELVAAEL